MTEQIKAALRGDPDAAAECTARRKLLPCPFCGGQDIEIQHCHAPSVDPAKRVPYFPIGCPECGAWIGSERTEREAIGAWNRRVRVGREQINPCENEDCEFFKTLARGAHCDAEDVCGGYYSEKGD